MNSLNGGYAMIKYNSTQKELEVAYKTKRPVLLYDENRRAHWAVIEETATESVDEETQEPITIYEYSYRLIDEASGGKLYHHHILIEASSSKFLTINITSTSNVAYTYSTIYAHIHTITNGIGYAEKGYNCLSKNGNSYGYSCCAINNLIYTQSYNGADTFFIEQSATVTDTITEA